MENDPIYLCFLPPPTRPFPEREQQQQRIRADEIVLYIPALDRFISNAVSPDINGLYKQERNLLLPGDQLSSIVLIPREIALLDCDGYAYRFFYYYDPREGDMLPHPAFAFGIE